MRKIERDLATTAERPWPQGALDAPGPGRRAVVSLETGAEDLTAIDVLRSARTPNGTILRQRILQRNRACVNAIHPDSFRGPAFEQASCYGSQAQANLTDLAAGIVDYFEDRVTYQEGPDPLRARWTVGDDKPRAGELLDFQRAAHPQCAEGDFNADALVFARALDRIEGAIHPSRAAATGSRCRARSATPPPPTAAARARRDGASCLRASSCSRSSSRTTASTRSYAISSARPPRPAGLGRAGSWPERVRGSAWPSCSPRSPLRGGARVVRSLPRPRS